MPGHSRPKDSAASLAYDPGIHDEVAHPRSYIRPLLTNVSMDCRDKPGNDSGEVDVKAVICNLGAAAIFWNLKVYDVPTTLPPRPLAHGLGPVRHETDQEALAHRRIQGP